MNCERQIDMKRLPGKAGGLIHYARLRHGDWARMMRGHDIVAVNDPVFTTLRPKRLEKLLAQLKRDNGKVFLTAMSTDLPYLDMLAAEESPLRYSEWFVDGRPSRMFESDPQEWVRWHNDELVDYQNKFFDSIDGAVSVLYEYHLGMERRLGKERAAYGGIPVDVSLFEPVRIEDRPAKVKLFLGRDRNRKLMKGTDLLEDAAAAVVASHPGTASLEIVENRPYAEFVQLLRDSHVVLDQIYSYTPATTALMAMAYGLNTVSGGEPEYYDFIGEKTNRPIINAPLTVDELTETLTQVVEHPERLAQRGRDSREFVIKHNACETVAGRFLDFWTS